MCAILGVSFAPDSTIDRRKLAAALLAAGEVRGSDASGYAAVSPSGDIVYKKDVPGSKLYTGKLPQDATAMILHTRAATHGSARDMENNHPVLSPSGNIRLVHNGVIRNHEEVRALLGKTGKGLPEVDSSVIPALLEEFGIESTDQLGGYASAAWFDTETEGTIHLARFKTSSVAFATLWDGSFVFASTPSILAKALNKAGHAWYGSYPDPFDEMAEGDYYQLLGGEIVAESEVEWKRVVYTGKDYSAQTSGGQKAGTTTPRYMGGTTSVTPTAIQSAPTGFGGALSGKQVERKGSEDIPKESGVQPVLSTELFDENGSLKDNVSREDFENWVATGNFGGDPDFEGDHTPLFLSASDNRPLFYTEDHDGNSADYLTLASLTGALSWVSGVVTTENHLVGPDEGHLRWVNHIADIGSLSYDGGDQTSWVRDDGDLQAYSDLMPTWVAEGVSKLRQLVGA